MYIGDTFPGLSARICTSLHQSLERMAKSSYAKKRTSFKYGRRHRSKKSGTRVAKRSAGSSSKSLEKTVAAEVKRIMSSGKLSPTDKVTLTIDFWAELDPKILVNGKPSLFNYTRLPVTRAIPCMPTDTCGADLRRRSSNKIQVVGVSVRLSLLVSEQTRVMMFVYEPHEEVRRTLDANAPIVTDPDVRIPGAVPEVFRTRRVSFFDAGIVSKHGPLMVRRAGEGEVLDSGDGTPFESRVATHGGKPIGRLLNSSGSVYRKKFGGGLARTVNWDNSAVEEVGAGAQGWTTHLINEYWRLEKPYTYARENSGEQLFERDVEVGLYIDCPSADGRHEDVEQKELVGAIMRNVVVDVYTKNL